MLTSRAPWCSRATASSCPSRRTSATTATRRSTSRTRSWSCSGYFPEDADQQTRGILARYSDLRFKAMAARQRGARAIVVVTGPRSPNAGQTVPMTFDTALAGSGIPAASVSGTVAAALFAGAPRTLQAAQQELDSGNPHAAGFALEKVTLSLKTSLVRETQTGRNVVAYLPATASVAGVSQALGRGRRALRSPRARAQRQFARQQGRRGQAPRRRRRQRVGQRGGAGNRRGARQTARATPASARRAVVGRRDRSRRVGGVRQCSARSRRRSSPRT